MLKQKTKKSIVRRFKITGSGKVLRRSQYSRHRRRNKTKRQIRKFNRPQKVGTRQGSMVKKLIVN